MSSRSESIHSLISSLSSPYASSLLHSPHKLDLSTLSQTPKQSVSAHLCVNKTKTIFKSKNCASIQQFFNIWEAFVLQWRKLFQGWIQKAESNHHLSSKGGKCPLQRLLVDMQNKKKKTSLLRLTDLNFKKFWACFSEYLGIKVPVNSVLTCPRSFRIFFWTERKV